MSSERQIELPAAQESSAALPAGPSPGAADSGRLGALEDCQAPLGCAMFIVTDDPRRPPSSVGAAWLGLCLPRNTWQHPSKDEQMPLLRSLAHRGAPVPINMALLTELFASPPPRSTVLKMRVRSSGDGRTPAPRRSWLQCQEDAPTRRLRAQSASESLALCVGSSARVADPHSLCL